jgi:hypothetical protein
MKAGWAETDITPPVGVDLCGFGGRSGPSTGVHDRLLAKALYLADEGAAVALITADLIGLDAGTVSAIRQRLRERLGAAAPETMIACSHTHSGPTTPCLPSLGTPDTAYLESLQEALVGPVAEARARAQEAAVGFGQAAVQVGINRRERRPDGQTVLGRHEAGLTAPTVDVMRVETTAGCAVLFSHAAHPVTLGGDNLLISADWPGYAHRFAQEALGEGCLALYAQGCCGNLNSDPRGSFDMAEEQGRRVAAAAAQAAADIEPTPPTSLAAASVTLELPLDDPPPLAEAQAVLAAAQAQWEAGGNYGARKMHAGVLERAQRLVALAQQGATGLTQPFEVQAFRIGDIALVGLPGEVFVEYQHQIKACSPFAATFVLAYTNGNIGYLPTAAAFPEGGYEVDGAILCYGTTMLTPDCERLVVDAACGLLRRLTAA